MNAPSRVSSTAATSSTFMHASGIVREGGLRQLGLGGVIQFLNYTSPNLTMLTVPKGAWNKKKKKKISLYLLLYS